MYEDRGGKHGRPFAGKGAFYNDMEEYPEDPVEYQDAAYYTYQPGPEAGHDDWWNGASQWGYYQEAEPNEWNEWPGRGRRR